MPYIKQECRTRLSYIDNNSDHYSQNVGELNFEITSLIDQYIIDSSGLSYATLNGVIGVLECAKLELYRRVIAPYEDIKIKENGDVYTCV